MKAKQSPVGLGLGIGIAVLLGVGVVLAGLWLGRGRLAPKPAVGVIAITGDIGGFDAQETVKLLRYAEERQDIKGVVLAVDSFGGDVASVEEIYLALLRFREKKPVVASLDYALSGGYYVSLPVNWIYAKPGSFVGSLGVFWFLPFPETVDENLLTSGPFKATGFSVREALDTLEIVKENFLQAVITQRGKRLKASKEELTQAKIYPGTQALSYGLVDAVGSREDALEKVAELAGLPRYQVVDINRVIFLQELEELSRSLSPQEKGSLPEAMKLWQDRQAKKPWPFLPRYLHPLGQEAP